MYEDRGAETQRFAAVWKGRKELDRAWRESRGWSRGKPCIAYGFADHGKDLWFGKGDHCSVLSREEIWHGLGRGLWVLS